ncbi:ChuX/HutX family heme-like substrate-binding protein, partial [Rhizobium leguminosarum]|uniref:ChuX/HutX family heme-like substrate-binding protein n=1 Tax=Rhizobium leguminosarum TaxID=384 RepID=UPI003F9D6710
QIAETWAVRKPTTDGHVTSLEAYNSEGEMIIQFFGKRQEGSDERADCYASSSLRSLCGHACCPRQVFDDLAPLRAFV